MQNTCIRFLAALAVFLLMHCPARAQYTPAYVDSLKKALAAETTDSIQVKLTQLLGEALENSNTPEAIKYLKAVFDNRLRPENLRILYKAKAARELANTYSLLNDSLNCEWYLKQALDYAKQSKNSQVYALALNFAAVRYASSNQTIDKGIDYQQQLIRHNDSISDPESNMQCYYGLGQIMSRIGLDEEALDYYKKGLAIKATRADSFLNRAILYHGMADYYLDKKQYDTCYQYATRAVSYIEKSSLPTFMMLMLPPKIESAWHLGKLEECRAMCYRHISYTKQNGVPYLLCTPYVYLARCMLSTRPDSAGYYLKESIAIAEQNKLNYPLYLAYDSYSEIYTQQNNLQKAVQSKQKAYEFLIKDRNEKVEKQAAYANVAFQTKQQQKELALMQKQARQQRNIQWLLAAGLLLALATGVFAYRSYRGKRKAAETLEQSNREKDILLKEIHHRVKNNLQVISSLLYLQFKDTGDAAMLEKLKQARQRIKTMALVHNKLYEKQDVVHVYLKEYIADLATGILQANNPEGKDIRINISGAGTISLGLDTSISLGLLLNELITNSCKYAFEGKAGGSIDISITQQEREYRLVVKDSGAGLPDDYAARNSLGMRLVKNLARQMNGTVEFTNENGAVAYIHFKEAA